MSNRFSRIRVTTAVLVTVAAIVSLPLAGCGDDDNGPITTISQAILQDGDAELEGFVHIVEDRARLCGVLRESFPPQCGDPAVEIANVEVLDVELATEQDVSWTDLTISVTGTVEDGVLTIAS